MHSLAQTAKSYYRNNMPLQFRMHVRSRLKGIVYFLRYIKVFALSRLGAHLKIVLGAALTYQKGWHSTNEQYLDIRDINHWIRLFGKNKKIKAMLAEHVFEHLTYYEMSSVLDICFNFLEKGGTLLIAVPDGNHPDQTYREHCGVNGIGADASDHKQFITFEILKSAAQNSAFNCCLLEGYDALGQLHTNYTPDTKIGKIIRTRSSSHFDVNKVGWDFPDSNTSMIALLRK